MIVAKTIALNKTEPAALSFRAPLGMETKLDVTFLNRRGKVYNSDLAAQLQLTARSDAHTTVYPMPAIDVVNGKARALIPANTLNDPNGYRLRVVGTFEGEPALLAMGLAMPIAAAGPQALPADIIDTIDLTFERNEAAELNVKLWDDSTKQDPFDLTETGTTVAASIYTFKGGTTLVPFTVTVLAANEVRLSLTVDQVNVLPDACWWSLVATTTSGSTTLCEGVVAVSGSAVPVQPPTETVLAVSSFGDVADPLVVMPDFVKLVFTATSGTAFTLEAGDLRVNSGVAGPMTISMRCTVAQAYGEEVVFGVGWNGEDPIEFGRATINSATPIFIIKPLDVTIFEGGLLALYVSSSVAEASFAVTGGSFDLVALT